MVGKSRRSGRVLGDEGYVLCSGTNVSLLRFLVGKQAAKGASDKMRSV